LKIVSLQQNHQAAAKNPPAKSPHFFDFFVVVGKIRKSMSKTHFFKSLVRESAKVEKNPSVLVLVFGRGTSFPEAPQPGAAQTRCDTVAASKAL
jgi:hypothetical protein